MVLVVGLTACSSQSIQTQPVDQSPVVDQPAITSTTIPTQPATPTMTVEPPPSVLPTKTSLPAASEVPLRTAPYGKDDWKELPVIPELTPRMLAIIEEGLAKGNRLNAFSKIGDCESRTTWFLGDFDLGESYYELGPYKEEMEPIIAYYQGSYNRLSMAAKPGFSAASLMAPIWADKENCEKNETPLACEYRLHKPSMAFITVGTNDATDPKPFEGHLRKVIEYSLEQGVLPILGTKADNKEKDESINRTMARLAYEYEIPLWNFWKAVQPLPGHGLQEDGDHLTFCGNKFSKPHTLSCAWPVRNLNALQILRVVHQAVVEQ